MRRLMLLAGSALLTGLMAMPAVAAGGPHYELVDKIQLPGKGGHGDFVLYDPSNRDVYVSMPNGVAVVSTESNKVVHAFKSIQSPNSMAFDADHVYWTEADGPGKANQIVVISKKDWKIVNRVNTAGTSPDGIWLDPDNHKLYVAMDDQNDIEVYSTGEKPSLQGKIALVPSKGSGPDVGVLVASKNTLYMPDDAWEETIDLKDGKVTHSANLHIKVTKKGGAKGQVYDAASNQLWVGTTSAGMLVLDASTLKVVKRLPAHGGIDQVSWDSKLGLAYAFEGKPKGFDVYDTKNMKPVTFVKTGAGQTHTGEADSDTHNVYAYAGVPNQLYVYKPEK